MNLQCPINMFLFKSYQSEMEDDLCNLFGLWSRFMQLSNIVQVRNIEILILNE